MTYSTREVVRLLRAAGVGCSYHSIVGLLRTDQLVPPSKDLAGRYQWRDADIQRCRELLQRRQAPAREAVHA
jgi:hypothetical protein